MGSILVGSVYGPSPRNAEWYRLQRLFLDACDDAYELAVFLNGVTDDAVPDATIVGRMPGVNEDANLQHQLGLSALTEHFVRRPGFDGYLILDSDAFPIARAWRPVLEARMESTERLPQRDIGAVVRVENLDTFAHPCVAYFTPAAIARAATIPGPAWTRAPAMNLLGQAIPDVSLSRALTHAGGEQRLLPLLRTNAVNPHPVLAAVYDGLFYHHGAGSRQPQFRRTRYAMADRLGIEQNARIDEALFEVLRANPQRFVRLLTDDELALRTVVGDAPEVYTR